MSVAFRNYRQPGQLVMRRAPVTGEQDNRDRVFAQPACSALGATP